MATWPANGTTGWNTAMLAYLAVSFNVDGTPKASVFGYSAYTNLDSEDDAMVKAHAYKAATDGFVSAYITVTVSNRYIRGYVGDTDDPAGAGSTIVSQSPGDTGGANTAIFFAVAKDEYFEITTTQPGEPTIRWKSVGTLSKPVDQD